jgi:hypothetical protein
MKPKVESCLKLPHLMVWFSHCEVSRSYTHFIKNSDSNAGVQGKNNAYHNVNKVENSFIGALILNLIDIVVCVAFVLCSSTTVPCVINYDFQLIRKKHLRSFHPRSSAIIKMIFGFLFPTLSQIVLCASNIK